MKFKYFILFFFTSSVFAIDFTDRTFLFPEKNSFVSDLQFSFKRWNYEYEDEDLPLNEDLLEVEKEALLFEPEIRYGLSEKLALTLGLTYQFEVLAARIEEQVGINEIYRQSNEKVDIHSPHLGIRHRFLAGSDTFVDLEGRFTLKTNKNLDPTLNDLNSQIYNGSHVTTLKGYFGAENWGNILGLSIAYNHYFDYEKRFTLFDEVFHASNFYNIAFGIDYIYVFDYGDDLAFSFQSAITDSFEVKDGQNTINFKENVNRQFGLRYTNYHLKDNLGLIYFDFKQVFELNRMTYINNSINIESDNTYTTITIGITTKY